MAAVTVVTPCLGPSPQPPSWASRSRPQCPVSFLWAGREVGAPDSVGHVVGMLLAVLIQMGPQAVSDAPDPSGVTSSDSGLWGGRPDLALTACLGGPPPSQPQFPPLYSVWGVGGHGSVCLTERRGGYHDVTPVAPGLALGLAHSVRRGGWPGDVCAHVSVTASVSGREDRRGRVRPRQGGRRTC